MLYVSFVEIFAKSRTAFEDTGLSERAAYLYTTLCFFGGFISMKLLDKLVHLLDPDETGHDVDFAIYEQVADDAVNEETESGHGVENRELVPHSHSPRDTPDREGGDVELGDIVPNAAARKKGECASDCDDDISTVNEEKKKVIDEKLHRMGLVTALAIGIHNFPEGLATFVATLADPTVGIALAVAIAIHNVPEGLCVAIPIYYASNNKYKAFAWAVISGLSEIVAAGLGWLVLSHIVGDMVYAILFGVVSGMMVNICIYQLLPTAHKYDPADSVVSNFCFAGMAVMAISLVAFQY
jgi:ZIP family zinc transporter